MAKIYEFKNRDGMTPMTDEELLLIFAFRQASPEWQRRFLELAKKPKQPEPGRS